MRLIGPDGNQLGIRPLPEALNMARDLELDLVEVADKANPPVCRIMDYGKYRYETAQKAKESKRKSTNVIVKEMKYRPKIGHGDFDTKTRKVEKFLGEGHKVKVTIMFRGREMQHPELGRRILDQVAAKVVEVGRVEIFPKQDGRNMTMVLGPDKKAQDLVKAQAKKASEAAAAAEAFESGMTTIDGPPEAPELVGTEVGGSAASVPDADVTDAGDPEVTTTAEPPESPEVLQADEFAAEPATAGDTN